MDLSRTRIVLRERALVDVLDLALRFLVRHGAPYAKTAAIVLPPFIVVTELVARNGGALAAWVFAIFTATFAAAPFTVLASRLVFEDEVRVGDAVGTAVHATWRLFVLRLVTFFGAALGLVVFTFPGVWLLAVTLFVVEVTVLEQAGAKAALARSERIFRRGSGEAIMALLLLFLLHVIVVFAADIGGRTIVSALLESRAPPPVWAEGWSTLALLGFWLFVPYLATARFLVYLDIRTRSEGWDIQTRFTALATRSVSDERSAA
jgi:hypothetical protein